jgi:hypothetical protein
MPEITPSGGVVNMISEAIKAMHQGGHIREAIREVIRGTYPWRPSGRPSVLVISGNQEGHRCW